MAAKAKRRLVEKRNCSRARTCRLRVRDRSCLQCAISRLVLKYKGEKFVHRTHGYLLCDPSRGFVIVAATRCEKILIASSLSRAP